MKGERERDTHPALTRNISKLGIKMAGGKQEWSGSETSREPTTPFHRYRFIVSLFTFPARECRQKIKLPEYTAQHAVHSGIEKEADRERKRERASERETEKC